MTNSRSRLVARRVRFMGLLASALFISYPPLCCKDPTCACGRAIPCKGGVTPCHLHLISWVSCILVASFQSKGTVASMVPVGTFHMNFLRCFFSCKALLLSAGSSGSLSPLLLLPRAPPDHGHLLCPTAHCSSHTARLTVFRAVRRWPIGTWL